MSLVMDFLRESNAIEGVYDNQSLAQAVGAWEYCISQCTLTPGVILETHRILMFNQPLKPEEIGYFRKIQVYIGGGGSMHHSQLNSAIDNWCSASTMFESYETDEQKEIGAQNIQDMHVEYENIHPFVDGNGRTGRIFMNWQRLKIGLPILTIKASERQEYYKWFDKL